MQFDNQNQKNLVVAALNNYNCKLGDASQILAIAKEIAEAPVVPKEHVKRKTDKKRQK